MIKGIAHTCYSSADLDRTVAFYAKLGLPVAFEFKNEDGVRSGVYLRVGNRTFMEFFKGGAKPADAGMYRHICLECDDVAETVRELRAKGLDVTDPKSGTDHSWQAWLSDPDGNPIELHGYTPDSWQTPHL